MRDGETNQYYGRTSYPHNRLVARRQEMNVSRTANHSSQLALRMQVGKEVG